MSTVTDHPAKARIERANTLDAERNARKPGLRLDTISGLHGRLIEYVADSNPEWGGWALVERDECPFPDLPYSVHRVYTRPDDGAVCAEAGHYEMSLTAARTLLAQMTGRRSA